MRIEDQDLGNRVNKFPFNIKRTFNNQSNPSIVSTSSSQFPVTEITQAEARYMTIIWGWYACGKKWGYVNFKFLSNPAIIIRSLIENSLTCIWWC